MEKRSSSLPSAEASVEDSFDSPEEHSASPAIPQSGAMGRANRPANIRQVAQAAEVSIATVSRVMNTPHLVAPETSARVLRAVREFGYSPNRSAQALAGRRRSYAIGVVLPEGRAGANAELLMSVARAARRYGYHTVVSSPSASEREVVTGQTASSSQSSGLPFGQVDGLALLLNRPGNRLWEQARAAGVPIATFDPHPRDPFAISVSIEHTAGVIEATTHLLESVSPSDCFFVAGDSDQPETMRQSSAFLSTVAKTGHTPDDDQTAFGTDALEWGAEWAAHVLEQNPRRPVGVLAGSPEIGYAILSVFARSGRLAPEHLRIVVIGEHPMSALIYPPLSTVRVPIVQAADAAIEALIRRIEHPRAEIGATVWATSLAVRESSRPG